MDVLQVGNKKYIKASVAAASLGYTSDYVGQLCRSGKVDAQLVGRSWYVLENSIKGHKTNRYRSTHSKSVAYVKEALKNTREPEKQSTTILSPHFYSHQLIRSPRAIYKADSADLLPTVRKTAKIDVDLADAEALAVSSENDQFVFDTPSTPKIKFKGTLVINEYDEKLASLPEGSTLIHPQEVHTLKMHKKADNKVISSKPIIDKEENKDVREEKKSVKVTDNASHISPKDADARTKVAYVFDSEKLQPQRTATSWLVTVFCIFLYAASFVILFLLVTVQTRIDVVHGVTTSSLVFNPVTFTATVSKFVLSHIHF